MQSGVQFDDEYEICTLTRDTLKGAIRVLIDSYLRYETVAKAVKLLENPEATQEIIAFLSTISEDGHSLVAIHKPTKNVVGIYFCTLRVKIKGTQTLLEPYIARCHYASSKMWLKVKNDAATAVDLFELCNTKCMVEILAAAVSVECQNKGIARQLALSAVQRTRSLATERGDIKLILGSKLLPPGLPPGGVSAVVTVEALQRLAVSMGFTTAAEINYCTFKFENTTLDVLVGVEKAVVKTVYFPIGGANSKY